MKITKDSHLDHELTSDQLDHIAKKFEDRTAFFKETFNLPDELGMTITSLLGPAAGMPAISEKVVHYEVRHGRRYASRLVRISSERFATRLVTVIAGPSKGEPCVLYTAYGGPLAPREPGDPAIESWEELIESRKFWAEHALHANRVD